MISIDQVMLEFNQSHQKLIKPESEIIIFKENA